MCEKERKPTDASHQSTFNVGRQEIGHGDDGRISQRLLFLMQLTEHLRLLLLLLLRLAADVRCGSFVIGLMMIRQRTLIVIHIVTTVIQEIHEQSEVFEKQLRFGFHEIASITLFGLQGKGVQQ